MHKIIVNIKNLLTIANIKTISPYNLKAYVDRAIK